MRMYRLAYPVIHDPETPEYEYYVDDFDPPEPRAELKFIEWPSNPYGTCWVTWVVEDGEVSGAG